MLLARRHEETQGVAERNEIPGVERTYEMEARSIDGRMEVAARGHVVPEVR